MRDALLTCWQSWPATVETWQWMAARVGLLRCCAAWRHQRQVQQCLLQEAMPPACSVQCMASSTLPLPGPAWTCLDLDLPGPAWTCLDLPGLDVKTVLWAGSSGRACRCTGRQVHWQSVVMHIYTCEGVARCEQHSQWQFGCMQVMQARQTVTRPPLLPLRPLHVMGLCYCRNLTTALAC
jgi:hypothetical protein